jgi:hypothetical protein
MARINGVIDTLDYELQLEPRLTPQFELSLDTEPALLAIEAMDLYEMKGISCSSSVKGCKSRYYKSSTLMSVCADGCPSAKA